MINYDANERKKNYHTVRTIPKSNIKIVERDKIDTPDTQIHDRPLSSQIAGTSVKRGGVKIA